MASVTMEWESRLGRRLRVRDLYILSTVVKSGSMAKAARALAMSQPAVSEAIANLEHLLHVRLLDRNPRGIEPTIYADAMLKRSMTVFDELKQGVRDIEFLADPTTGELTIGYANMIAATVFPKIIERFSEEYPRVVMRVDLVPIGYLHSGTAVEGAPYLALPETGMRTMTLNTLPQRSSPLFSQHAPIMPRSPLACRSPVSTLSSRNAQHSPQITPPHHRDGDHPSAKTIRSRRHSERRRSSHQLKIP